MKDGHTAKGYESLFAKAAGTFWGYTGCELVRMDDRKVTAGLDVKPHHLNMLGIVHGGVYSTLLDSVMGLAAMAVRPEHTVVTSGLNVHFLAPVRKGRITAVAEVILASGKTIMTKGTLTDESGEVCSAATATFRVLEKRAD
ncbi:MAG TPA: PaaI family thioesterase [Paenibacillus sp.]|uniref:PaaI family thioesterase n=1 Tax=Paenibacillus sp. TaxID=58172 RepID=UPI002C6F7FC5|nr:PaaI family thioesterase [Paenibacillus sp.]HUC93316.1 PaaI family thioesterase [Paenibacillus sp.]